MAPHDPLFKGLLRTFFAGFLRLVAPELAARLELSAAVFLDKELTAGPPLGGSRVVDLLVRVPVRNGNGRAAARVSPLDPHPAPGAGPLRRALPAGRPGGIREESLLGDVRGPGLSDFRYLAFGLEKCPASRRSAPRTG